MGYYVRHATEMRRHVRENNGRLAWDGTADAEAIISRVPSAARARGEKGYIVDRRRPRQVRVIQHLSHIPSSTRTVEGYTGQEQQPFHIRPRPRAPA